MSAGDPAAVERELLMYAARARAKGLDIVCGAFEEYENGRDSGRVTGVCALGAYNATAKEGEVLSLPKSDRERADLAAEYAWDAIEMGFDGEPVCLPTAWWAVGHRLREELNPRKAVLQ